MQALLLLIVIFIQHGLFQTVMKFVCKHIVRHSIGIHDNDIIGLQYMRVGDSYLSGVVSMFTTQLMGKIKRLLAGL